MMSSSMFQLLQDSLTNQKITALITITNHSDRNYLGKKLLIWEDGSSYHEEEFMDGFIFKIQEVCISLIERKKSKVVKLQDGVECFVEIFLPAPRLIVAGAGHVCEPVVQIASMLGYEVTVVDDRPEFATVERFPLAKEVVCDSYMDFFRYCPISQETAVLLLTRGHKFDVISLYELLKREETASYIGMIGSRRRIAGVFEQLKDDFDEKCFDHIYTPVGLDIGAETPAEIAISILAEMLKVRNKKSGSPLSGEIRELAKLGFRGGSR
jgi:xanthine dehydrogenase accessory factor